jgi:hypothetical protein
MLFRKSDGSIIEVKKTEYKNDISYYTNLMKIKTETRTKPTKTTTTTTTTTTTLDPQPFLKVAKDDFYSKQAINKLMKEFC